MENNRFWILHYNYTSTSYSVFEKNIAVWPYIPSHDQLMTLFKQNNFQEFINHYEFDHDLASISLIIDGYFDFEDSYDTCMILNNHSYGELIL